MFPGLTENRGTRQRLSASRRGDFFDPGTDASGTGHEPARIQAGFRPPFTCTPQPFKAEPHSGLGRLPKAPRCHACEAQPQAPHPTGLGYPAPAKLSLCPTSGSPLEAPLTGQDPSRIRDVPEAGITIPRNSKNLMLMNGGSEWRNARGAPRVIPRATGDRA
ncbi:MAG: hypothetical protein QOJ84_1898 [Bradyrhizobium sp.]|jgi:hypothetical protein|nr:hypothetical protein [Bradyrhizobium sp.]